MSVDEYKAFLASRYEENQAYIEQIGGLEGLYAQIDTLLGAALEDWNSHLSEKLRKLHCPPMIFPVPKGDNSHSATFCIILKMDNDGDTVLYSPIPLSYFERES